MLCVILRMFVFVSNDDRVKCRWGGYWDRLGDSLLYALCPGG